jgi:hypothetical protein
MSVTAELKWDDFFTTPHPDEAHDAVAERPGAAQAESAAKTG